MASRPSPNTCRWRLLAGAVLALAAAGASAGTVCKPTDREGVEECVAGLPLPVVRQMQQAQAASNWCWAAVVSMILQRYGLQVPQREVAEVRLGEPANEKVALDDITGLLNRSWRDGAGRAMQASAEPLPNWWRLMGLAAPDVLADLHQDRPLVLVARHHAMVLVQVTYERTGKQVQLLRALVLDPAGAGTLRYLRPSERTLDYLARVEVRPVDDSVATANTRPWPATRSASVGWR